MVRTFQILLMTLILAVAAGTTSAKRAHALDKRVKLMFKTAGYGAAAGLVAGAGVAAMGAGDGLRTAFMGASLGLYAGIGLGAYILLTPDPEKEQRRDQRTQRPRRVGPDDWRDADEEEYDDLLSPEERERLRDRDEGRLMPSRAELLALAPTTNGFSTRKNRPGAAVWAPVLSIQF